MNTSMKDKIRKRQNEKTVKEVVVTKDLGMLGYWQGLMDRKNRDGGSYNKIYRFKGQDKAL